MHLSARIKIVGVVLGLIGLGITPVFDIHQATAATPVKPAPPVGRPVKVWIPKIGAFASVESLTTDQRGILQAPKSAWTVGWYRDGYRPGEPGNALMYGHINTYTSKTGVFTKLNRLAVRDQLIVIDDRGIARTFRVTAVAIYSYNQAPIEAMLSASNRPRLVLYTCAGTWNRWLQNYTHRLVIYSELVSGLSNNRPATTS